MSRHPETTRLIAEAQACAVPNPQPSRYSPDQLGQAQALYEGGCATKRVGERMGLSYDRARRLLQQAGVAFRKPGGRKARELSADAVEAVLAAYASGVSADAIRRETGVHSSRILDILRQAGVAPRSHLEACRVGGRWARRKAEKPAKPPRSAKTLPPPAVAVAPPPPVPDPIAAPLASAAPLPARRALSMTGIDREDAREMILLGYSIQQIARRLNASEARVRRYVADMFHPAAAR